MSKILVIPDIHGRKFWIKPTENIDDYNKVIFLGDYLDPYGFEFITVQEAIDNFMDIIEFKKKNMDKVILLLGNHDMPYFSKYYKELSRYNSRYSSTYAPVISGVFNKYKYMFQIAYTQDDILFTHAGCSQGWIVDNFGEDFDNADLNKFTEVLNELIKTEDGLKSLRRIGYERGGDDRFASCIWADKNEIWRCYKMRENPEYKIHPIQNIKQVFGHTLQGYYGKNGEVIIAEDPCEYGPLKMLDIEKVFELDTETFTVNKIE